MNTKNKTIVGLVIATLILSGAAIAVSAQNEGEPGVRAIAPGAISTELLADNAVNANKIDDTESYTITEGSVTLSDGALSVTDALETSVLTITSDGVLADNVGALKVVQSSATTVAGAAGIYVDASGAGAGTYYGIEIAASGASAEGLYVSEGKSKFAEQVTIDSGGLTVTLGGIDVTGTVTLPSDAIQSGEIDDGTIDDVDLSSGAIPRLKYFSNTDVTVTKATDSVKAAANAKKFDTVAKNTPADWAAGAALALVSNVQTSDDVREDTAETAAGSENYVQHMFEFVITDFVVGMVEADTAELVVTWEGSATDDVLGEAKVQIWDDTASAWFDVGTITVVEGTLTLTNRLGTIADYINADKKIYVTAYVKADASGVAAAHLLTDYVALTITDGLVVDTGATTIATDRTEDFIIYYSETTTTLASGTLNAIRCEVYDTVAAEVEKTAFLVEGVPVLISIADTTGGYGCQRTQVYYLEDVPTGTYKIRIYVAPTNEISPVVDNQVVTVIAI